MATETRTDGQTPNGGTYSIAYWQNENGQPVDQSVAVRVEVIEYDQNGEQVWRTYGDITPE